MSFWNNQQKTKHERQMTSTSDLNGFLSCLFDKRTGAKSFCRWFILSGRTFVLPVVLQTQGRKQFRCDRKLITHFFPFTLTASIGKQWNILSESNPSILSDGGLMGRLMGGFAAVAVNRFSVPVAADNSPLYITMNDLTNSKGYTAVTAQ